jgi:predicted DNA-binding WGR domain protein
MIAAHLTKIIPEDNQWRYYRLQIVRGLFDDWGVIREWGRIGRSGHTRTDWFDSEADAEAASARLAQQKGRRGYKS